MKLDAIVALWRETQAPEAALAAHHVAMQLPHETWPATPGPLHEAWMKRAVAKPSAETIAELMRVSDVVRASTSQLLARFERMATWSPDPNLTRWLVDVFARPTRAASGESQKVFRRIFNLLIDHVDLDGVERLRGWLGTNRNRLAVSAAGAAFLDEGFERVLAKSSDRLAQARALTAKERASLAGLQQPPAPTRTTRTIEALLDAVYAAPDDDAPRAVLADVLQERGDPRGELIALDLLKQPTAEQRTRRNALINKHGRGWFPTALHKVVKRDAEYQRGFLARGTLLETDKTPIELSTFRELATPRAPELAHPVFRSVEAWTGFRADAGVWKLQTPQPRIRRLGMHTRMGHAPAELAALIDPEIWPSITELVVDVRSPYGIPGWDGPLGPEWIDTVVNQLAARFPRVQRIAIEPFAVYERDGTTTQIYLPKVLGRTIMNSWDAEPQNRWLDWLAFCNKPVLVDDHASIVRLQPMLGQTPVKIGNAQALASL